MTDNTVELNAIQNGRFGIDIRMPIYNGLRKIEREMNRRAKMVDISAELAVIANNPRGANVKQAIHDAMYKLSQVEGGGYDLMADICFRCTPSLQVSLVGGVNGVAVGEE